MSAASIVLIVVTLVAGTARAATAQAVDPSGHWDGVITAPFGEIPIALDIARRDGTLVATFSRGDGSVTGFPLSDVELNGSELKMTLKASGGGTIRVTIAGSQMTGAFAAFAGTADFAVRRTGEARFAPPPVNKAVSETLEGTWTARLAAGADAATFRITLRNNPDRTATATMADDHGVEVPVKVEQEGTKVTIDIPTAHSTFTGTINSQATAIEGNYVEGALNAPVTFRRAR
jgi:hypothetical protein